MNFEHFLTKKILSARSHKNTISAPIIKIGVFAISISMIVMLVALGVGFGMQKEIKKKISTIEGDITIQNFNNSVNADIINPISPDESFINELNQFPRIKNIEKIISKFGIVRTKEDFDGIIFKGVESSFDFTQINKFLIDGNIPSYNEKFSNNVLISNNLANNLNLKIGDNFQMIFNRENKQPSIIKLNVNGIYSSGFDELDSKYIYGDIKQLRRINRWKNNQVSSLEIYLNDDSFFNLNKFNKFILWASRNMNIHDEKLTILNDIPTSELIYINSPSDYDVISVEEKYFFIFEWIDLFDKNIIAILFIMTIVAALNIISILIVLILDRTNMIGILKVLGATNFTLSKFFVYKSAYLISKGLFFGNLIGLLILFIQKNFKLISLDPKIYYVNSIPIDIELSQVILLNLIVFILCILSILFPSLIVSNIKPKETIKFN